MKGRMYHATVTDDDSWSALKKLLNKIDRVSISNDTDIIVLRSPLYKNKTITETFPGISIKEISNEQG